MCSEADPVPYVVAGGGVSLVRGDAVSLPLADESVDLIVTSPPYFALRSYTDGGEHYEGQIGSEDTPQAFLEALWAVTAECRRVLKPSGSMWVNLGDKYSQRVATRTSSHQDGLFPDRPELKKDWKRDRELGLARMPADNIINRDTGQHVREKSLMGLPWRYAIGCIDNLGLILRAEVVWSKPNGLPESVTDRVRRSHEQWFHFTRELRYFAAVDEVREPHADTSIARSGRNRFAVDRSQERVGSPNTVDPAQACNPLGKLPGSVWTIPSEPLRVPTFVDGAPWGTTSVWSDRNGTRRARLWRYAEDRFAAGLPAVVWECDHFAAFPQEWPRRLILGWSPSGICVECGEGRRPVADGERSVLSRLSTERSHSGANGQRAQGGYRGEVTREITGYACACHTPTAPTRPAVVLDPFGGTGTVAMVARALGRYPVHIDLSRDYLRLARWRVYESGHAAKSRERTNREAQATLDLGAA